MKKKITVCVGMLLWGISTQAQVVLLQTTGSSIYSQNFDGLGEVSVTSVFSQSVGVQTDLNALSGVSGMQGWYGVKRAGSGATATHLLPDSGTLSGGGIYSYGDVPTGDRALGLLASVSNVMAVGLLLQNDTGSTMDTLVFHFNAEFWRSSSITQNVLTFGYGKIDGSTLTNANFLTASGATGFASLNVTGPVAGASAASQDGNSGANRSSFSNIQLTGLNLAQGETLFVRWSDVDETGSDAGIALDDFSLGTIPIPEPSPAALFVLASLACWGYRRFRS